MKGTAAIVATVVCLGALADTWTDPETGVEWTYTVLDGVTIHDGVVGIGTSVFESCGELRSVRLPNGMTSIGSALFRNCGALAEVTIPRCVTSIEGYAFQGCGEIASVTIPRGVTYIGDYAFEGCRSLTNVVFMGNAPTVAWWSSGLIPSAFNGVGESCEVYVSKMSTGWGVSVGDGWLGMTLRYWPELLTPVDSIAAARGIVSEFADERVAACVESLDDYAQLAAWAGEILGGRKMSVYLLGDTNKGSTAWSTAAVPEPTSGLLLLLGMAGLALKRKRA